MAYFNFKNAQTPLNDTNLDAMQKGLMELVFPIGATYVTQTAEENPEDILGFGTWERLKGKVCVGVDKEDSDFNEVGKTGGTKSHQHLLPIAIENAQDNWGKLQWNNAFGYGTQDITSANYLELSASPIGSQLNMRQLKTSKGNNLQPYEVVGYIWIRRK